MWMGLDCGACACAQFSSRAGAVLRKPRKATLRVPRSTFRYAMCACSATDARNK